MIGFFILFFEPFFVQYHAARCMGMKENHAGQSGLDLTDEKRLTFCFLFYSTQYIILFFFPFAGCCQCRFIRAANWRGFIVQQPALNMKYQSNRGKGSSARASQKIWLDISTRVKTSYDKLTRYRTNQEADANKRNGDRFVEAYHTASPGSPVSHAVTRVSRPPAFTRRCFFFFLYYSLLYFLLESLWHNIRFVKS